MSDFESHGDKLDSTLLAVDKKLSEAKDERKNIQIGMALATAIITAVVGFAGWLAQSRVQQHIDEKSQELEARLAMTQQVYGRKLAIYESVHQQVTGLVKALGQVQVDSGAKKSAVDALSNLYMAYTTDSLYLSDEVVNQLKQLVILGGQLPSLDLSGSTTMDQVTGQISSIEVQMKTDLGVKVLGAIPGSKP